MAPSSSQAPRAHAIKIPLHANLEHQNRSGTRHGAHKLQDAVPRAAKAENGSVSSTSSEAWTASPSSPLITNSSNQHDPYHHLTHPVASPSSTNAPLKPIPSLQRKDKQRALPNEIPSPPAFQSTSPLGPNMLSSSSYKSVNLNSRFNGTDGSQPPRLITYTKHSQGFTWNDELFLPSYMMGRGRYNAKYRRTGSSGRHHGSNLDAEDDHEEDDEIGDFDEDGERCPVTDIFVTDEEADAMIP